MSKSTHSRLKREYFALSGRYCYRFSGYSAGVEKENGQARVTLGAGSFGKAAQERIMSALHRWVLAAGLLVGALPAQAIVGGIETTAFKNVNNGESNSGVQFTDNWVLTANHLGNSLGGVYGNGYGSATVDYLSAIDDLVLLHLETPISAAPKLDLLADSLPVGQLATIVSAKNQAPNMHGYAFTEVVKVTDEGDPLVFMRSLITYLPPLGVPYVQGGDSGGGLFLGQVTDSGGSVLMGITSVLYPAPDGFSGLSSGFIQLSAFRGWIDSTMANYYVENGGTPQVADWVLAVPEPSSWALFAAGGALLLSVSARRPRNSANAPAQLSGERSRAIAAQVVPRAC